MFFLSEAESLKAFGESHVIAGDQAPCQGAVIPWAASSSSLLKELKLMIEAILANWSWTYWLTNNGDSLSCRARSIQALPGLLASEACQRFHTSARRPFLPRQSRLATLPTTSTARPPPPATVCDWLCTASPRRLLHVGGKAACHKVGCHI